MKEEPRNPDEVISEYFNHLMEGNYSQAMSMMINDKGERLSDQNYIKEMDSRINNSYDELFSRYIRLLMTFFSAAFSTWDTSACQ